VKQRGTGEITAEEAHELAVIFGKDGSWQRSD
jgi:hypothetical protein